jgi:tyrosine-protein phosphatase SIW14
MRPAICLVLLGMLLPAACNKPKASSPPPTTPPTTAAPTTTAATVPTTSPTLLTPHPLPGLPNFAQVSPMLYRGAQPTAEGFAQLKKMGVKTVINLRWLHSDRDMLKGLGLQYVNIECKAWHPEEEDMVQVLKLIEDPANQPVFVHCQHGADRTGCAIAVYRMVDEGWSSADATRELPNFNFHPIWGDIKEYLQKFDAARTRQRVDATPPAKVEVVP